MLLVEAELTEDGNYLSENINVGRSEVSKGVFEGHKRSKNWFVCSMQSIASAAHAKSERLIGTARTRGCPESENENRRLSRTFSRDLSETFYDIGNHKFL